MSVRERIPERVLARLRPVVHRLRSARDVRNRKHRRDAFHRAVCSIEETAPAVPSDEQLAALFAAWSNDSAGDVGYMKATVERALDADRPILECGSGLTTVLLAIFSQQPVISLESHETWRSLVQSELDQLRPHSVRLVHAPLTAYNGFHWYDLSDVALPDKFGLVVCDGPACSDVPGGRVGLLPVLGQRIIPGAIVVVDEHMQKAETAAIGRWRADFGLVEIGRTRAVLTLQRC